VRLLGGWLLVLALCVGGCDDGDEAAGDRPDRSRTPAEARKCLDADGFQTEALSPDVRKDPNAPDHGLLAYRSGSHAEIAFYDELARAKRYEPEIRENAEGFDGRVERIGRATIVWLTKPSEDAAERVERCVGAP
jgi:hypothetical protein